MRRAIYGLWRPSNVAADVDRRIRDQVLEARP
jgi:hypothetical protein